MPNHITTRITFEGERADLDALFAHIRNDETESPIDFDQILPMPKELEGTTSPWKGEPFEKSRDPAMVKRQYALEAKYGHGDWYSWSCENWGTKWNAYDVSRTGDAVEFDTAWACPLPVLTAISAAHPQVRLVVQFADAFVRNSEITRWVGGAGAVGVEHGVAGSPLCCGLTWPAVKLRMKSAELSSVSWQFPNGPVFHRSQLCS